MSFYLSRQIGRCLGELGEGRVGLVGYAIELPEIVFGLRAISGGIGCPGGAGETGWGALSERSSSANATLAGRFRARLPIRTRSPPVTGLPAYLRCFEAANSPILMPIAVPTSV